MDVLLCAFRFQRQMKTAYILSIFIIHRYKCILNYRNIVRFLNYSCLWFYEMGKPPLLLTMIFNDFRCSNIPQQIYMFMYLHIFLWPYESAGHIISAYLCDIIFCSEMRAELCNQQKGWVLLWVQIGITKFNS